MKKFIFLFSVLTFLILTSFSETWFDGLYINSTYTINLNGSIGQYWAGELSLIKAEKGMISFMLKNGLIDDENSFVNGIFLYKYSITNNLCRVWLRKRLVQNFKDIKPIITGLVVIIKKNSRLSLKPAIKFQDGTILNKFNFTPPFFEEIQNAMESNIIGGNPLVLYAYQIKNGDIILYDKDKKSVLNACKVFDFIKFNRIIFILK